MWSTVTALFLAAFVAPGVPPTTARTGPAAMGPAWEMVAPGLGYQRIEHRSSLFAAPVAVHAFRFSLAHHELRVLPAGSTGAYVGALARSTGALLAVNGGFFLEDFTPLGLLVSEGRELNPLRKVDWGIFLVARGVARIVHRRAWKPPPGLTFAIEAGPRLVVDGRALTLKPQRARRTALGVTESGDVVIVATEGRMLTSDLAALFQRSEAEGGLGCPYALNLDGGSSTQLWFSDGGRTIAVAPGARIANAVALFSR